MSAQPNLALFTSSVLLGPLWSEQSQPFVQAINSVYEVADHSEGFVWRPERIPPTLDAAGRPVRIAYGAKPSFYDNPDHVVQTLSLWRDLPAAWGYVYRGAHLEVLRQRTDWMHKPVRAQYVLWWCDAGSRPTHVDGVQRLEQLDAVGPTAEAFTFRVAFDASGQPVAARS